MFPGGCTDNCPTNCTRVHGQPVNQTATVLVIEVENPRGPNHLRLVNLKHVVPKPRFPEEAEAPLPLPPKRLGIRVQRWRDYCCRRV